MRVAGVQPWARSALLFAAIILAIAAQNSHDPDKRSDMAPVPFVMGSRYGRSEQRALTPRNDRFYMGTRYGKRSSKIDSSFRREEPALQAAQDETSRRMICEYTGIPSFYRCVRGKSDQRSPEVMPRDEDSD